MYLVDLRVKLNQMSERIISNLKDRSRFSLNNAVYVTDGVEIEGRKCVSFLNYALEGLEEYHASLGRYDYPDQYPVFADHRPWRSSVRRQIPKEDVSHFDMNLRDKLIEFYISILPSMCQEGDDSFTYGETVYVDADTLEKIHERINVGRYVAESKLATNQLLVEISHDNDRLKDELRDETRERAVIARVKAIAIRYELDPAVAEHVFRWIIDQTLNLEVDYLQKKFQAVKSF